MSGALLLSSGIAGKKNAYPELLRTYHPDFKGISFLEEALILRKSKKILDLGQRQRADFKVTLESFLEEYRTYVYNRGDAK